MINFITLYSSSSGNCTLFSDGDTNLLIDAGVSASRIKAALCQANILPENIDGIFVTHEHSDHIAGIRVMTKKYNIPVYANAPTMEYILKGTPELRPGNARIITAGNAYDIRSIRVKPFPTPHDAVSPMGYILEAEGKRFGVATDTGHITKTMLSNLAGCEAVLIESNHDEEMLKNGDYPYMLKKRILSDEGHLSNNKGAWLATQLAKWGTKRIALGHLSAHNNTVSKAYDCCRTLMESENIRIGNDILLRVAPKDELCEI